MIVPEPMHMEPGREPRRLSRSLIAGICCATAPRRCWMSWSAAAAWFVRLANPWLVRGYRVGRAAYRGSKAVRLQTERRHSRRALSERVMELSRLGWSRLAIQRELGLALKTIRKWQRDKAPESWERMVFKPDAAEPFEGYLHQRWAQGCRNATRLYREICGQGYQGNAKAFRHWVKVRLRKGTPAPTSRAAPAAPPWRPPTPRQAVRLVTKERDMLAQPDREFVEALCTASPEITRAAGLARRFQAMIQIRDSDALAGWLEDTLMSPLASFARGLLRDVDAVRAALSLPWSSGPVEGKINKLKLIKRSMYGRAGLDLLRARVMGC